MCRALLRNLSVLIFLPIATEDLLFQYSLLNNIVGVECRKSSLHAPSLVVDYSRCCEFSTEMSHSSILPNKTSEPCFPLRLKGGVQGWAPIRSEKELKPTNRRNKRKIRVEKGRMIKEMKNKFKVSNKKKLSRVRRLNKKSSVKPIGANQTSRAGWTASEEDSNLEIFDDNGNRLPIHPDNSFRNFDGKCSLVLQ